eukprot:s3817_g7.t1
MQQWLLFQCPADESVGLDVHVASLAQFLLTQLLGETGNVQVQYCWSWGDGDGDGQRQLHLAQGNVELQAVREATESLVVITQDGGYPCGLVLLGSCGRLSRINRHLWVTTSASFRMGASPCVEARGSRLDACWLDARAASSAAASVYSYFHCPRSFRVPDRPSWSRASLRPRTWMPIEPLNALILASRPGSYGELLLEVVVVDWYRRGCRNGGQAVRTLHVITWDSRTRLVTFRTAIRLPHGSYSARAMRGDWVGHGPAYVTLWNRLHSIGIPENVAGVLALFDESLTSADIAKTLSERYTVVMASPGPRVRKTSLFLVATAQSLERMLVIGSTTVARTQAVGALLRAGYAARMRVIGHQRIAPDEVPLSLDHLVSEKLRPLANQVSLANSRLNEELKNWQEGQPHQVTEVHERFVACRERAEEALPIARAEILEERPIICGTLGSLLRPTVLPTNIRHIAIDEAGVVPAADLIFLVLNLAPFLAPDCKVTLLGDPCQDCCAHRARAPFDNQIPFNMTVLQYILHRIRSEQPTRIRELVRFANGELRSARIRPRVAALAGHTWLRRSSQVLVDDRPLMFSVQPRPNDANSAAQPELVWVEVPDLLFRTATRLGSPVDMKTHMTSPMSESVTFVSIPTVRTLRSTPECCPVASFCYAAIAVSLARRGQQVAILCRYRAQCALNVLAVKYMLRQFPSAEGMGRIHVATSLGIQGRTVDHVLLCLPVNCGLWNSFHLEPRALLGMIGRTRETLYLLRHVGALHTTLPGRHELAALLQWWEEGPGHLKIDLCNI